MLLYCFLFFMLPLNERMNEYLYMAHNDFSAKPSVTPVSSDDCATIVSYVCVSMLT